MLHVLYSAGGKVVPVPGAPPCTPPRFLQSVSLERSARAAGARSTHRRHLWGYTNMYVKNVPSKKPQQFPLGFVPLDPEAGQHLKRPPGKSKKPQLQQTDDAGHAVGTRGRGGTE